MLLPQQLKKILVESGFVGDAEFNKAAQTASTLGQTITDQLIFQGLITEDALGKIIAEHFKVPFVTLKKQIIPIDILNLVPEQAAFSFHVIPFKLDNENVHLAMENPQDLEALEFVKRKTHRNVIPYYITSDDFNKTLGQYKRKIREVFTQIVKEEASRLEQKGNLEDDAESTSVITVLDRILEYAYSEGTSDIHIELQEKQVLLRFRVDGILRDISYLPKSMHAALVARIKILSGLKIDEHRIPQDGRFKFKIYDSFIALRVSILPAFFGENIVMRILAESVRALSLHELGMIGRNYSTILESANQPNGMILVTGPTGSGKTTTLYTVLTMLNQPERKICTIEDPIEYSVARINQTQVNAKAGMDFAAGLRSLLRHDPDVIMIGEIRDGETAEISIHSALTGHLVLSTLHTNSAAGAIPRFKDMGVQGFLLASTLNIIIAQRLVRRVCTACMVPVEYTNEMKEFVEKHTRPGQVTITDVYEGKGCNECHGSGYKGRLSIFEVLEVTPEIKQLIVNESSEQEIADMANKLGMDSLVSDGLYKVSAGLTTFEEVIRVTNA